jgi:hypothetical protein
VAIDSLDTLRSHASPGGRLLHHRAAKSCGAPRAMLRARRALLVMIL